MYSEENIVSDLPLYLSLELNDRQPEVAMRRSLLGIQWGVLAIALLSIPHFCFADTIFSTYAPGSVPDFAWQAPIGAAFITPGFSSKLDSITMTVGLHEGENAFTLLLLDNSTTQCGGMQFPICAPFPGSEVLEFWSFANLLPPAIVTGSGNISRDNIPDPITISSIVHPTLDANLPYWLMLLPNSQSSDIRWYTGQGTTRMFFFNPLSPFPTSTETAPRMAIDVTPILEPVPEPATLVELSGGLIAVVLFRRLRITRRATRAGRSIIPASLWPRSTG